VSGHDWLYRNGEVIADQDMPIYEGATEVFSDAASSITFGNFTGDSFGNYVIGGATDNPDLEANRVLVVNNETVIARKGDPVDLNNDGIFNDNAYFDIFRPRGFFLDNSGNLYFVATLMDSSNFGIGDGIFIYDLSAVIETPIVYMPFAANRD
jgi:hypothetical protein